MSLNRTSGYQAGAGPLESWSRDVSFYGGAMIIRELYSWDKDIPSDIASIPGFEESNVWHQQTRYVEMHSGELQDIHDSYYATGKGLEKIKNDFKSEVMNLWQLARVIYPEFPHHTNAMLDDIFDPAINGQSRWGPHRFSYARIEPSCKESHALNVQLLSETKKGSTSFRSTTFYDFAGKVVGVESWITRKNKRFYLTLKNSKNGMYIWEIEVEKSMYGHVKERDIVFSSRGVNQYEAQLKAMGLEEYIAKTSRRRKGSELKRKSKPKNSVKSRPKNGSYHVWTKEDEHFIMNHPEMTHAALAKELGVTIKSIERKKAKLRLSDLGDEWQIKTQK